ncbi:MAG: hypothetical protein R3C05_01970 [Pirellulaceae bacterium]
MNRNYKRSLRCLPTSMLINVSSVSALLLVIVGVASAATVEKVDLFESGKEGYALY